MTSLTLSSLVSTSHKPSNPPSVHFIYQSVIFTRQSFGSFISPNLLYWSYTSCQSLDLLWFLTYFVLCLCYSFVNSLIDTQLLNWTWLCINSQAILLVGHCCLANIVELVRPLNRYALHSYMLHLMLDELFGHIVIFHFIMTRQYS